MTGEEARQKSGKWSHDSEVIFDEGEAGASFIWGTYGSQKSPSLGMRWNLSEGVHVLGFPHLYSRPAWIVIPDVIVNETLLALLKHVYSLKVDERNRWEPRIRNAISESINIGGSHGAPSKTWLNS